MSVGCVLGFILCRYSMLKGDLLALSCASVRLVCLGRVCSVMFIFGGWANNSEL